MTKTKHFFIQAEQKIYLHRKDIKTKGKCKSKRSAEKTKTKTAFSSYSCRKASLNAVYNGLFAPASAFYTAFRRGIYFWAVILIVRLLLFDFFRDAEGLMKKSNVQDGLASKSMTKNNAWGVLAFG